MPILAGRQRKQRTNAGSGAPAHVYNAPGIYYPPFGRTKIYVSGHGVPGNSPTPGTTYYNPETPGNYAGSNPGVPGNIMYNPGTLGNTENNLPTGGEIIGYNPPTKVPQNAYGTINHSLGYPTRYDSYRWLSPTEHKPYTVYIEHTINYGGPAGGYRYEVWNVSDSPQPGNAIYSPVVPGEEYTNDPVPGNIRYNPPTLGEEYTNNPSWQPATTLEGNKVPGNYSPGNTNPGTYTEGNYVPASFQPARVVPGTKNEETREPGTLVPAYVNPPHTFPGNFREGYTDETTVPVNSQCPVTWTYEGHVTTANGETAKQCSVEVPPGTNPSWYVEGYPVPAYYNNDKVIPSFTNPDTYVAASYTPAYTNPATYEPGNTNPGVDNTYYNPSLYLPGHNVEGNTERHPPVPGNIMYNPGTPGETFYNPPEGGNVEYLPGTAGNPGTPFTSLGVMFPGGAISAPGPYVEDTLVNVSYSATGVSVNVGSGGQVVIKESL